MNDRRALARLCLVFAIVAAGAADLGPVAAVSRSERVRRRHGRRLSGRSRQRAAWSGRPPCPWANRPRSSSASRVYVTASEADQLVTIGFDAATGREAWRQTITPRPRRSTRRTIRHRPRLRPTTHGVVVFFGDFGLAAYAPDGKQQWALPLGPFKNFYGMAGSPIIAGDAVILVCDRPGCIIAVDRQTGRERWRRERPRRHRARGRRRMVFAPGGGAEPQLVVLSSTRLDGYALATGEPRWWMPLSSMGAIGTAVAHGDAVIVRDACQQRAVDGALRGGAQDVRRRQGRQAVEGGYATEKAFGEHFGWVDADGDGASTPPSTTRAGHGVGEYGVAAIRPSGLRGKVDPAAAVVAVEEEPALRPDAGGLQRVDLHGEDRRHHHGDRSANGQADQGRSQQRRPRR